MHPSPIICSSLAKSGSLNPRVALEVKNFSSREGRERGEEGRRGESVHRSRLEGLGVKQVSHPPPLPKFSLPKWSLLFCSSLAKSGSLNPKGEKFFLEGGEKRGEEGRRGESVHRSRLEGLGVKQVSHPPSSHFFLPKFSLLFCSSLAKSGSLNPRVALEVKNFYSREGREREKRGEEERVCTEAGSRGWA